MESKLYSRGSRNLQDRFDTRRIADRLETGETNFFNQQSLLQQSL